MTISETASSLASRVWNKPSLNIEECRVTERKKERGLTERGGDNGQEEKGERGERREDGWAMWWVDHLLTIKVSKGRL